MSITEEIKQKLDIVEIVSNYTNLQKSGRNFRALCPFHSEKTPSFFVFPEKQTWHCFGACSTGGDIFSFIMKKEGLDFGQALRFLAERAGVILISPDNKDKEENQRKERLFEINDAAAAYYHHILKNTALGEKARDYLTYRGISEQIVISFQLGFSPDSYDETKKYLLSKDFKEADIFTSGLLLERDNRYYDRFRNRLMFPIRNIKGGIIGFGARALDDSVPKYLNSPQTAIFDKGSSLYAIDKARETIRKKDFVTIMEGYMDVLTAHQHGYENSVASMGTALGEKQLASLKNFTRNIIIALDADTAGKEADLRTSETLAFSEKIFHTDDKIDIFNFNVKVILPTKGKDPDEEIKRDPAAWGQSIEKAQPIMSFVISTAKDKIAASDANTKALVTDRLLQLVSKIDNSIIRGHYIQEVARILKMRPSELIDQVNKIRRNSKKGIKRNLVDKVSDRHLSSLYPIERYCLCLLIRCPELRQESLDLNQDYFEHDENKEIYLKWQQSNDQDSLRSNLDALLHPYLDELLSLPFPPSVIESEERRRKDFIECLLRLRENLFRNLAAKKADILAAEAEIGGKNADITKLEEQGIEESIKLKQNFAARNRRSRSIV